MFGQGADASAGETVADNRRLEPVQVKCTRQESDNKSILSGPVVVFALRKPEGTETDDLRVGVMEKKNKNPN